MPTLTDIALWRAQIFRRLLLIVLICGGLTALPSIGLAVNQGMWPVAGLDAVALAWIAVLWRAERLPYRLRVYNFLAIVYIVGVGLMLTVGPISQIYLMAAPLLGAVLLGKRPALFLLACSALTIFVLSLTGHAKLHVDGLADATPLAAAIITINYLFIGAIMTLSSAVLLQRLERSLREQRIVTRSLETGQDALRALNAELRLTATAVARLNDIVIIARVDGDDKRIIFANDAFERRTGYTREDVLGQCLHLVLGEEGDGSGQQRLHAAMAAGEAVGAELRNHTRAGSPYWIEAALTPFADEGGKHTHWVAVGRDITERKKSEQDIHRLAFYDVLTGLPNRRLLMDRLDALLQADDGAGSAGAVLFIDLDHFKYLNDARGHASGDTLLCRVAERLGQLAGAGQNVARIGGDEFVVLLPRVRDTAQALEQAERIRDAMLRSFDIDGQPYRCSASIGVTLLRPGQTAQDLLREADTAMYRAKASGRNGVALFETAMQTDMQRRLTLARELGEAMERGGLAMHFQVQVDGDGRPAGAELLMRWRRADGAMVPPDVFIPIAEESGLIVPLGKWALRQACHAWLKMEALGCALPLSVNVSPSQFRQPDFVEQVRAILQETGAPAQQIVLEVTESLLVTDLDDTIERMHELAALGIRFSIDDFGTGYSSLAYLKRMPLYELKIDRSFIRDTPADANGTAIVQSVLAMARHLGLRVVAEGVETGEQAVFLMAHGCPGMQGYLYAKPAPLDDMLAWLAVRNAEIETA